MNFRAIAEAMPDPAAARDYLLDVLERETPQEFRGQPWPGVRLTRAQARVLAAIAKGSGEPVCHQHILSAMYFDRLEADYPDDPQSTLRAHITHIRGKLPPGVRIVSVWRWGYRLDLNGAPDPWSDA